MEGRSVLNVRLKTVVLIMYSMDEMQLYKQYQ